MVDVHEREIIDYLATIKYELEILRLKMGIYGIQLQLQQLLLLLI